MIPLRPVMLLAALLLATAPPAAAQLSTGAPHCTVSATTLSFGSYSAAAHTPDDLTATIRITCVTASRVPAQVHGMLSLSSGIEVRQMISGRATLRYQLYTDPGRSVAWGSGGLLAVTISGVATATEPLRLSIPVYGRVLARQFTATEGSYADTIAISLVY